MKNRHAKMLQNSFFAVLAVFFALNSEPLIAAIICDIDENGSVLENDIDLIFQARNRPSISPFDPMDIDRNGVINTDDARQCVCALPTTADCQPPLNQAPVVNAGPSQRVTQVVFSAITLNGDASDPDQDPIDINWTFQQVPTNSQVSLLDQNSLSPSFTPDQFGRYEALLTVTDRFDAISTSTVVITVEAPDSLLEAIEDRDTVESGQTISGNILANDVPGIGATTIRSVSQNGQPITLGVSFTTAAGGSFLVQPDGSYTYTAPSELENPIQETFSYTIIDESNASSLASLIINVDPVVPPTTAPTPEPTPPPQVNLQANPDTNATVSGGGTVSGNVLSNDQFQGAQPQVTAIPGSSQPRGRFTLNSNGSYSYTPPVTARSSFIEQFPYRITDSSGQFSTSLLTITVEVARLAPVAREDLNATTAAGAAVAGNVLLNDSLGNQPTNVSPVRTNFRTDYGGLFTLQSNGSYTYLPPQSLDDPVTEGFDYTITDLDGQQSSSFLAILVNPENREPVATPDSAAAQAGGAPVSGNLLQNDDPGNQPTVVAPVQTNFATSLGGVLSIQADGNFTYTPPQTIVNISEQEVFDYTITDADGESSVSTLTITVTRGNLVPVAEPDQNSATAGGPVVSGNVLNNDQLGDQPTQLTGVVTNVPTDQGGLFSLSANGSYTYMPPTNLAGVVNEQFDYSITDRDGESSSSTLTIMVSRLDLVPMANPDTNSAIAGGVPATGNVLGNDNLGNQPTLATPINVADPSFGDSFSLIASGEYSYMPPASVTGVITRVFNYTITDSDGQISTSTVTITVNPAPVVLTCNPDLGDVTAGNGPIMGNVLTNDVTGGRPVQVATLLVQNTAIGGSINLQADGNYTYTPPSSVTGVETEVFTYTVTNTSNTSESCSSTISITVNQENLIPLARPDQNNVVAGSPSITGNVLTNDDPGDPVTVVTLQGLGQSQIGGSITLDADGSYTYTPPTFVPGVLTDSFDYRITDADGEFNQSTLTITVNPVNLIPFAREDTDNVKARAGSTGVQGNVLDNDDQGNLPTSVRQIVTAGNSLGLLNIEDDGRYSYLPPTSLEGIVTEIFNYRITDNDGETSDSILSVTVTPTCRAVDDTNSVMAGGGSDFSSSVTFNNNRVSGNVLTNDLFCVSTATVNPLTEQTFRSGSIELNADGSYTYIAPFSITSTQQERFDYTVTDAEGDSSSATLIITVKPELRAVSDFSSGSYLSTATSFTNITGKALENDLKGREPTTATPISTTINGCSFTLDSNGDYTFSTSRIGFIVSGNTPSGPPSIPPIIVLPSRVPCFQFSSNSIDNGSVRFETVSIPYTITDSDGDVSNSSIFIRVEETQPVILF